MKNKIVAGNWKMNLTLSAAEELLHELAEKVPLAEDTDVFVFPPSIYVSSASRILNHKTIDWGVQNVFYEKCGAFTGEVSASMLKSMNGTASIVGHSERRQVFNESNAMCQLKVKALLENELKAFLCCGEPEHVREEGKHIEYVLEQLDECLSGVEWSKNLVIAYEPIWAIGTGKTAHSNEIEEMHSKIAYYLSEKWGEQGKKTPLLYGGSCKPENVKEIFSIPHVDGGLIGGASLDASSFVKIIMAAHESH